MQQIHLRASVAHLNTSHAVVLTHDAPLRGYVCPRGGCFEANMNIAGEEDGLAFQPEVALSVIFPPASIQIRQSLYHAMGPSAIRCVCHVCHPLSHAAWRRAVAVSLLPSSGSLRHGLRSDPAEDPREAVLAAASGSMYCTKYYCWSARDLMYGCAWLLIQALILLPAGQCRHAGRPRWACGGTAGLGGEC